MSDLLPPNATLLERNLAAVNAVLGELPVPLRDLVRPDVCPSDLLPWLAQALSVDSWDMDWSETQKRDTIKASVGVHRVKGTIGAVRRALASLGIGAQLQEWFNQIPAGAPYTYRLLLEISQAGASQAQLAKMNQIVEASKNLRSHLDSIHINVTSPVGLQVSVVTGIGHDVRLKYSGPSDLYLVMEGAVNGQPETEQAVDSIHQLLHATMPNNNFW
jgi:phage tail P2-like protein